MATEPATKRPRFAHVPSDKTKLEKQVEALEARLQRKHEVLSELMEEHIRLKKDLGEL